MLYIHKLNQLTPKTAEVESVYLIRELKQKTPLPLKEQQMENYLLEFTISDTDRAMMMQAVPLVQPIIDQLKQMLMERNPLHESVNIQRAIQTLEEMPQALINNINYVEDIGAWQARAIMELTALFNTIPKLRSKDQKVACDQELNVVFQRILRNKDFAFNFYDIINEAQVQHITDLHEAMNKGYFFHFTLEEELKKIDFNGIKHRIPPEKMQQIEEITKDLFHIKRGVERAYQVNMRMVNYALILFAYVKWMMSEQL